MQNFKKTWEITYVSVWIILIVLFFNFGTTGDLFVNSLTRAFDMFIVGLAFLILIKNIIFLKKRSAENRNILLVKSVSAVVIFISFLFTLSTFIYS